MLESGGVASTASHVLRLYQSISGGEAAQTSVRSCPPLQWREWRCVSVLRRRNHKSSATQALIGYCPLGNKRTNCLTCGSVACLNAKGRLTCCPAVTCDGGLTTWSPAHTHAGRRGRLDGPRSTRTSCVAALCRAPSATMKVEWPHTPWAALHAPTIARLRSGVSIIRSRVKP